MRRYLRTAAAWCLVLCLTLGLLPGFALAEEPQGAPVQEAALPEPPEEDARVPAEETETGAEGTPAGEPELRTGYGEADLIQAGSLTGPQTMPGDPGVPLAAEAGETDLYNVILTGIQAREERIDISKYNISGVKTGIDTYGRPIYSSDAFDTFYRVVNDHPELFYVQTGYSYSYSGTAGADTIKIISIAPAYNSELMGADLQEKFDAASEKALAQVKEGMSDLEKALVLHDYLVVNCRYNWEVGNNQGAEKITVYSAYGALVNGDAVCQGYALAYKYLLNQVDVPAVTVSSDSMHHMWNQVQIGGEWYHVDATWDDPFPNREGKCWHSNFLRSDTGIGETGHSDWDEFVECNDDSYADGYAFNGCEWPMYYKNNTYYYVRRTSVYGTYSIYAGGLTTEGQPVRSIPDPYTRGYLDNFGVVWLDDSLYYIGDDFKLYRLSLTDDSQEVSGNTITFEPHDIGNKNDFLGLQYKNGEFRATSATRYDETWGPFEFSSAPYPPAWEAGGNGICGLTDDNTKAGIKWDSVADATLFAAGYKDNKLTSVTSCGVSLENGVTLVDITEPDDASTFRLFLVADNKPLCAAWTKPAS